MISIHFILVDMWNPRCQETPFIKVAVNVSSSGKPVLRYMYYVNEPGLTLLMKKTP